MARLLKDRQVPSVSRYHAPLRCSVIRRRRTAPANLPARAGLTKRLAALAPGMVLILGFFIRALKPETRCRGHVCCEAKLCFAGQAFRRLTEGQASG